MKRIFFILIALLCLMSFAQAQNLSTQTVRGRVTDADSKSGIFGVNVTVINSEPLLGSTTDPDGYFTINNVPLGRISVQLSYVGYESRVVPNVIVNVGKEVVLALQMQESVLNLDEVIVVPEAEDEKPTNEMVLISGRAITMEQMTRMATGFNDPALITSNFAGVANSLDGGNEIVVRGNSPKYMQWRLEGMPMTTPNHFGDQAMVNGTTGILNSNLLETSDFYTGAFSPEFGNVIGGVYDVRLRKGNNRKTEAIAGIGLLGTDLTLEGPLKEGYNGSYLINYRYSTADILNQIGALDVDGNPKFQDAAVKFHLPSKKLGLFSVYALDGRSTMSFDDLEADNWNIPGTDEMLPNTQIAFDKSSFLFNAGVRHTYSFTKDNFLETGISMNVEDIEDDVLRDGVNSFNSKLEKTAIRTQVDYHHKLSAKSKLQAGAILTNFSFENFQRSLALGSTSATVPINFDESINNLRSYISLKHRFNQNLTLVAGVHNTNVFLNNEHTIEPRLSINWSTGNKGALSFGYGNHSTMEGVNHYFAQVDDGNGNLVQPNLDLGLLKAHHLVLGYNHKIDQLWDFTIEMYYQDLYDVPVANDVNNIFSTVNEGLDITYVDLVNEGKGTNTGIEMTLNRSFANGYYFMTNASVFESHYTALDGTERSTRFDSDYRINVLGGKEFTGLGKYGNKTVALNAKFNMQGAQKIIPLLRNEAGSLAVNPDTGEFYDYSRAYQTGLDDLYALTLSASFKWDKAKTTHELLINLENITDHKGRIREYYDANEPNNIGYTTQFGLLPNLLYRIYF